MVAVAVGRVSVSDSDLVLTPINKRPAFIYFFQSQELATAVYSTKWYLTRPKIRRELLFIIMKSQKAPKIYIGRFFALEMSTFVSVSSHVYINSCL